MVCFNVPRQLWEHRKCLTLNGTIGSSRFALGGKLGRGDTRGEQCALQQAGAIMVGYAQTYPSNPHRVTYAEASPGLE